MNVLFIKLILRYIQDAPLFASFILCEAICEFQDQHKGLPVVLVDAEKAIDQVSHDGVFRKLATLQIHMECWMVLRDWHRDFNNVVKWNGTLSPSTREHYKEVSSPHMHTRWRQRRTTRHPSPTYRGHYRNCVLCRPDMCRWCSSH